MTWLDWARDNWPALARGAELRVAPGRLAHPSLEGFRPPRLARRRGQVSDWVLPLRDGSRLHVHELAGGTMRAHRDRHDPGCGTVPALAHVAFEAHPLAAAACWALAVGRAAVVGV